MTLPLPWAVLYRPWLSIKQSYQPANHSGCKQSRKPIRTQSGISVVGVKRGKSHVIGFGSGSVITKLSKQMQTKLQQKAAILRNR